MKTVYVVITISYSGTTRVACVCDTEEKAKIEKKRLSGGDNCHVIYYEVDYYKGVKNETN